LTVLKETVIQLARQLPEIIIRQAFAFHGTFEKGQFFNMIDEASREHSTQPTLLKRLNILRKAWCASRTPPLNPPIPVSIAHILVRAPAPCNLSDEQKIEKFTQMVQDKDFPYLDLPSVLLELGVATVQKGLNRRVEQLKHIVLSQNNFQAIMDSLHAQINMRKALIYSKSHCLYINGKSTDVARILAQFKHNLICLPALDGTQRQQLRQILMSDHRHTVEAARILSRLTFPYADNDGGFTSVHNQEEVKRNRVRMTQIHTERLQSQSYTVNDNPFLEGALAWDEEMNNFVFPPEPCTSCQEQGLGMVITNGKCTPCESKTRAFKFSHNNSMDPKLAPPSLQGLSPTEISAISLINPVMSIHRVNSTHYQFPQ